MRQERNGLLPQSVESELAAQTVEKRQAFNGARREVSMRVNVAGNDSGEERRVT
jgi:hypothetical protein